MMNVLELHQVRKTFGSHDVLKRVDFCVPAHSILGFIGQNGAGKTTTMKLILGLLPRDAGEIQVCQETVSFGDTKANRHIGYLSDVPAFYDYLTPYEYLQLCASITHMPSADCKRKSEELLTLTGLWQSRKKRIATFSRGMKQRLGIAQALLNEPDLLIADEPTSALDPIGRKDILSILTQIKDHTTIIFSTHILSDVERVCDSYAILHDGIIQRHGSMQSIKEKASNRMQLEFMNPESMQHFLSKTQFSTKICTDTELQITHDNMSQLQSKLHQELLQQKLSLRRMEIVEPTLESLYMEVVK